MAKTKEWSDKGVKVTVDDDKAVITDKDYGNPSSTGSFQLIRKLVNFEVSVDGDHPSVPVTFIVCYTADDASQAGGANKLKLGMWDARTSDWKNIPLTRSVSCPYTGFEGAYEAKITARWPDPPVAWGSGG
ncbi:MAG: hypothetical protein PVH18_07650 [Chloroflexota bacterium]|jgi:hypothetical protein